MSPEEPRRPATLAATRSYAILTVIVGAIGTFAAMQLLLDHMKILADPNFVPACDLNPLIGCGIFLDSWQAHALGIPNPVLGLVTFPLVLTTGVVMLTGARLPRWYWRTLFAGSVFGIGYVTWLQYEALTQIGAICPYCLVVWIIVIPFFIHTLAQCLANEALPAPAGLRSVLVSNKWIITILWYLLVLAAAVLTLGESLLALL